MHTSKSSLHPETPIIVLKSIFQRYDADNDGFLNESEFAKTLDDLGIIDSTEQRALFALADSNNSKTVCFDDFIKLIKSNDFELILSSREDYEFVIETYKAFKQYDEDGNGQITWNEFYFYLTKHGYSHQYISHYWYYLDIEHKLTVSFQEFWKGFKLQAKAVAQHQVQKPITHIINKKTATHSKVLNRPSLIDTHSWSQSDDKNIFHFIKTKLKPIKQNKSPHAVAVGRVVDDDGDDIEYKDDSVSELQIKERRTSRLPDIIAMIQSPLHAILPSFKLKTESLRINIFSPSISDDISPNLTPNYSWISTPNYSMTLTPNYSLTLTPNLSNELKYRGLTSFPSISPPTPSSSNVSGFPSLQTEDNDSIQKSERKQSYKTGKNRKKKKKKKKTNKSGIDRTPVLRPRKSNKYNKKHSVSQSVTR